MFTSYCNTKDGKTTDLTPSQLTWWNGLLSKVINVRNGNLIPVPKKCKRCDYRTLTR